MRYISEKLRQSVFARANGLCEYCLSAQRMIIVLEIDHILPLSRGGKTELDNLCAVCRPCNGYKRQSIDGLDPETGQKAPLYNPRQDDWNTHFKWDKTGEEIIGLTPIGRATISRLKLNRLALVDSRQLWISVNLHPPK
ncbi:MAG: HNH endonuclease [bacterium]|nr:HNH endonuclease [bacterium]